MPLAFSTAVALVALASTTDAHAHHHHQQHSVVAVGGHRALGAQYLLRGLEADNATSTTDYTCPVCGMSTLDMGYDNHNFVELANGQRVYTCGMPAVTHTGFETAVTDTAYLAANLAEFVKGVSECDDSCAECADGIADPVTGETVTTDNFQYVCLEHGQKIYFASADSKAEYLGNITQEVRFLVEEIICESETCSDATTITTLSTAASSADLSSAAGSSTGSTAGSATAGSTSGSSGAVSSAVLSVTVAALAAVATALVC